MFLTLLTTFLFFGGPTHLAHMLAHIGVLAALIGAALAPTRWLQKKRFVQRLAWMLAVVLLVQATGLLPIPSFIGRVIAPTWEFERGDVAWDWSSIDVAATIQDMTTVALVGGLAMATSVAANRRRYIVWVLRGAAVGLLMFEIGADFVPSSVYQKSTTPPFIDSNHFGAALTLTFPAVLGAVRTASRDWLERTAWLALSGLILGTMFWHDTLGPAVACLLIAVPTLIRSPSRQLPVFAGLFAVFTLFALAVPQRGGISHGRFEIWGHAFGGGLQHWLFGSGSGTFEMFIEPLRTDIELHAWNHAHNDWLQWVFQTGVVGVIGLITVLLLSRSGTPRTQLPHDRRLVGLCLVALMIQAAFEFPLHLPVLAMAFVGLFSWWRTTFFQHEAIGATPVRVVLWAAVLLNGAGLLIQSRAELVEHYAQELSQDDERAKIAQQRLMFLEPGNPDLQLHRAKNQLIARHPDEAIKILKHLGNQSHRRPSVLRPAARLAFIAGEEGLAMRLAERAKEWAPYDERNWKVWALLITATTPEKTHEAWLSALRRGFNLEREAWDALPEGIVWASDLSGVRPKIRARMAGIIATSDPQAAVFIYQALRWDHPDLFPPGFLGALLRTGDAPAALSYWNELPVDKQQSANGLRQRANIARAQDDEVTMAKMLVQVWKKTGDDNDRRRAMVQLAQVAPASEMVHTLKGIQLSEGRLSLNEALLLADAYRRLGNATECAKTLSSADFTRATVNLRKRAFRLRNHCDHTDDR